MSTIAVEVQYTAPTTRPVRPSRDQRRGPQAHPDRLDTRRSASVSASPTTRRAITADTIVPIAAVGPTAWRLTPRGYAVLAGSLVTAATFLATMVAITFFGISNGPLG